MPDISPVYQPRKPRSSQYYQCVEDNFETLEQVYDDRFPNRYGFFRPYVKEDAVPGAVVAIHSFGSEVITFLSNVCFVIMLFSIAQAYCRKRLLYIKSISYV